MDTNTNTPTPLEWDDPQDGESIDEASEQARVAGCSVSDELRQLEGVSK